MFRFLIIVSSTLQSILLTNKELHIGCLRKEFRLTLPFGIGLARLGPILTKILLKKFTISFLSVIIDPLTVNLSDEVYNFFLLIMSSIKLQDLRNRTGPKELPSSLLSWEVE